MQQTSRLYKQYHCWGRELVIIQSASSEDWRSFVRFSSFLALLDHVCRLHVELVSNDRNLSPRRTNWKYNRRSNILTTVMFTIHDHIRLENSWGRFMKLQGGRFFSTKKGKLGGNPLRKGWLPLDMRVRKIYWQKVTKSNFWCKFLSYDLHLKEKSEIVSLVKEDLYEH